MRPSSEALLLSCLLNTQDVDAADPYGITPEMIVGYQPEYRWMLSYKATYGQSPTIASFLTKFPDFPLTDHTDVAWAADEVRYSYTRRSLSSALKNSAQQLKEGDLEEAIFAITSFTVPQIVQPLKNSLLDVSFLDTYDEQITGIELPWKTPQEVTGGLFGGALWFIAARLGQGKSWSVSEIAANALMQGKNVLFYSLEMAERQVQTRMHALLAKQLGEDIRHSEMHFKTLDLRAYRKLMGRISDEVPGKLFVVDPGQGKVTPSVIQNQCGQADLVIVDYVQLMSASTGGRAIDDWRVIASISNMLKEIAVAHDIPIVCAAQINRVGDTGGWKPPKTSQLAQSDSLGQDADVVITHKRYSKSAMVYSVEKNRHGESGDLFFTHFKPDVGDLSEITRDRADDIKDAEHE